jgi:hypothetical protein
LGLARPDGRGDCVPPHRFTALCSQVRRSCSLNFFDRSYSLSHVHSASFSGYSLLKCAPELKTRLVFDETKQPGEFPECTSAVLMFFSSNLLIRLEVFWMKGRKASGLSDQMWRTKEPSASLKIFISKNGKRPSFLGVHSEVYIIVLPV